VGGRDGTKSVFLKMGGTGYQPVFGGNLPPKIAAGWQPAATGQWPVPNSASLSARTRAIQLVKVMSINVPIIRAN